MEAQLATQVNWNTVIGVLGAIFGVLAFIYRRGGDDTTLKAQVAAVQKQSDSLLKRMDDHGADRERFRDEQRAKTEAVQQHGEAKRKELWDDIVQFKRTVDSRDASSAGAVQMIRDQLGEHREFIADKYATKLEVNAAESRLALGQDRMFKRMDAFEEKVDKLRTEILAAINGKH